MKFINVRVIEFSIAVTCGVIFSDTGWTHFPVRMLLPIPVLFAIGIWHWNRNQISIPSWYTMLTFFCFFLIGFVLHQINQPEFQTTHFSKDENYASRTFHIFQITEILKSTKFHDRYEAKLLSSSEDIKTGKILLGIVNEKNEPTYQIDDRLLIYASIAPIPDSKNPYQFNFRGHMAHQGIHHQILASSCYIAKLKEHGFTLRGQADKLRTYLIRKLDSTSLGEKEKSIVKALILGDKKSIDGKLYEHYVAAGAIHILAVSGLHVGIILMLLNFIFSPIKRFRGGKWIRAILILFGLWAFAFIAGLSPSVVRAATMFSLFIISDLSNRPTNSINTLFLSYFLLVCINPNWIFQIGFQFSYLAVGSILWIQPKLDNLWKPHFWIAKKLWEISTVSLAAQIGVAPLSIYYFHQFPGMFLITNLLILPFLSVLLIFGLTVILLAAIDSLPEVIARSYNELVVVLNSTIRTLAEQNLFLFENLSFSGWTLYITYIIIVSIILGWQTRHRKWGYLILASIIVLLIHSFYSKYWAKDEWILFHLSGKTLMTYQSNNEIQIYQSSSSYFNHNNFPLNSYLKEKGITCSEIDKLPSVFDLNGDTYIILDSIGVMPKRKASIVILTHNTKVHLERLIDSLMPKLIIADGSNYKSRLDLWKATCKTKKIAFYSTFENGAYRLLMSR